MGKKVTGLEAFAEDGSPSVLNEALGMKEGVVSLGVAAVPSGSNEPGPAGPGKAYSFTFGAEKGQHLSFSPGKSGLPLAEMDKPFSRDITGMIMLYDIAPVSICT